MIPLPVEDDLDDYMLAGTDTDFEGRIRLMRIDGSGNVVFSKVFWEDNHLKTCFDFTYYNDHYYITCLRRADVTDANDLDRIEIIEVDASGNITDDQTIYDFNSEEGMYPIHTLAYNNLLYVCGYTSPNATHPVAIEATTPKRGFILSYDPSTQTVANSIVIESVHSYDPNFHPYADYDMVVRLIPNQNGDLYVTGSSNSVKLRYNSPLPYPFNYLTSPSGTLNVTVDNTLSLVSFNNSATPLGQPYGDNIDGEFGHSMVEVGGLYYNVGNYFDGTDVGPNNGHFHNFTAIDPANGLLPAGTGANSRWSFTGFDYAWGLQTLPSLNGGDVLLAGMTSNLPNGCVDSNITPSKDDYNPFISDFSLGFAANTISVNRNFTRTYLSQYGTGTYTLPNSYHATNRWLFNNTWSANLACQRDPNLFNNLALGLTAPVWWSGANQLNFKFIQGDQTGAVQDCPDSYTDCFSDENTIGPVQVCDNITLANSIGNTIFVYVSTNPSTYQVAVEIVENQVDELNASEIWDCPADGNIWKNANNADNAIIKVFPNPTQQYITIKFNEQFELINIELSDLTGRIITSLYDGKYQLLPEKLNLPQLTSGIYRLQIKSDNKVFQQKLIIE